MAGNSFGKCFRISSFGESHGAGLGVVIDGCPAGLPLSEEDIAPYMARRRPGQGSNSTQRKEADTVELLSGVFEGKTTGTPIAMLIRNTDARSKDYAQIRDVFRPGHADFGFYSKYGFRDYRGGGRSSGRETAGRVAAGAVAIKLLSRLGVSVRAECVELAGLNLRTEGGRERADAELRRLRAEKDSAGGVIECRITGLPPGIGEPVFDKLDARLAQAVLSIGAIKAVGFGDGAAVARMHGSENNDPFYIEENANGNPTRNLRKRSNHAGGILGGMSDGSEIVIRAYVKPTPSIGQSQQAVNEQGEEVVIAIQGRHDPVVAERAAVVVECMCALVAADMMMENVCARMEYLEKIYAEKT